MGGISFPRRRAAAMLCQRFWARREAGRRFLLTFLPLQGRIRGAA